MSVEPAILQKSELARLSHHERTIAPRRVKEPVRRGLTFWLLFPAVSILVLSSSQYLLGTISTPLHFAACIPTFYFLAMCVHDAIHRAAHDNARLNALVGWISAGLFGLTYPVIRRAHLSHHKSFGHDDDGDDIESFVYRPRWTLLARLLVVNWKCYSVLPQLCRREKLRAVFLIMAIVALVTLWPQQVFWGWLLPMQIGIALFALMTVYLPHGPHSEWVMKHVPAVTGFHDDHHAMPQYPWYQYFSLRTSCRRKLHFNSLDDVLEEAERIAGASCVKCHGDWTAAQILEHLAKSFRSSVIESAAVPTRTTTPVSSSTQPGR